MSRPPVARGSYAVASVFDRLVTTAGMTPRVDGELWRRGRVGIEVTLSDAKECVRIATHNAIAAVGTVAGGRPVESLIRLEVYLACDERFTEHSATADAASEVLLQEFPLAGPVARVAVGVSSLPSGAPAEVALSVALSGAPSPGLAIDRQEQPPSSNEAQS